MTNVSELREAIADHLKQFTTAPYLFIGSGLSRRYLGLPDWEGLLREFAETAGREYAYFRASGNGDLPSVASAIAEELHEKWWTEDRFKEHRDQHGKKASSRESALKIELSQFIKRSANLDDIYTEYSEEIDLLQKGVIDGIITTNWDTLLESIFPGFRTFIGQDRLLFSAPQGIGEIYKIHGCCTYPDSLVVTRNDYDRFKERNAYLAAKLLTVFVEHPVLFLGYSLNDENVADILSSIAACLTNENIEKLRNQLIFVEWSGDGGEKEVRTGTIVAESYNIPVLSVRTPDFIDVYHALSEIPRKFPARMLRKLKEHVYELVQTNDPQSQLYVKDIDEDADLSEVDVVLGVGAIKEITEIGYRGIDRKDLITDLIHNDRDFNSGSIIYETLPQILKKCKYVPIFKYLRGFYGSEMELSNESDLDKRVVEAAQMDHRDLLPSEWYQKKWAEISSIIESFDDLAESYPPKDVVMYAPMLSASQIDTANLRDFLSKNQDMVNNANSLVKAQFVKLVCLYDLLTYMPERTI